MLEPEPDFGFEPEPSSLPPQASFAMKKHSIDDSSLGLETAKELGVSSRPASIDSSKRKAMGRSSAQARTHVRSGEGIGVGSGVQDSGGLPTNLAVSFLTHFLYYVHLPRSARHALARQYAL